MSAIASFAAVAALALFVYLIAALLFPENFS